MSPSPISSPLVLWANSSSNKLHEDWQSTGSVDEVRLTQGDTVAVELHWLKSVSQLGLIHDEVIFPANANVTLAIGRIDAAPEAGVFSFGYNGQHTADIDFDATPAEVQAALNALSSIASEGGVTVSQTSTSYKIVWNEPGVLTSSLTTYHNDLLPSSTIGIGLARAGASNVAAIYNVHIKQAPVAACTTWTEKEATELTIAVQSTVINGSQKMRTWVLEFSQLPRGGSFTFGWVSGVGATGRTEAISIDSMEPTGINLAFQRSGGWGAGWFVSTTKLSPLTYLIGIWVSTNSVSAILPVSTLTVDNVNVIDFSTKTGLLSLNTVEVESLLAGQQSVEAIMEVEVELAGSRQTIIQTNVVIVNDLIDTDVYDLVEWGSVIPADSVVRYDTSQSLTAGQKTQARTNIGALGASSLDALIAKDAELELIIGSQNLTEDELDALHGALTASATNLFLTEDAGDAAYAAIAHTHPISEITDLQTALNTINDDIQGLVSDITDIGTSKADVYHTQAKSTITGLDAQLSAIENSIAGFAPLIHTHFTTEVDGLEVRLLDLELKTTYFLTQDNYGAIVGGESPTSLNVFATESRVDTLISSALAGLQYLDATQVNAAISTVTGPIITDLVTLTNAFDTSGLKFGEDNAAPVTGNVTTTTYPRELKIFIDGAAFNVPMRRTY